MDMSVQWLLFCRCHSACKSSGPEMHQRLWCAVAVFEPHSNTNRKTESWWANTGRQAPSYSTWWCCHVLQELAGVGPPMLQCTSRYEKNLKLALNSKHASEIFLSFFLWSQLFDFISRKIFFRYYIISNSLPCFFWLQLYCKCYTTMGRISGSHGLWRLLIALFNLSMVLIKMKSHIRLFEFCVWSILKTWCSGWLCICFLRTRTIVWPMQLRCGMMGYIPFKESSDTQLNVIVWYQMRTGAKWRSFTFVRSTSCVIWYLGAPMKFKLHQCKLCWQPGVFHAQMWPILTSGSSSEFRCFTMLWSDSHHNTYSQRFLLS